MNISDTIIAPATAGGKAGIGIIRISGGDVRNIIKKILKISLRERYAHFFTFFDLNGKIVDNGIAIFFASPRSFTGEDMLELQGHGNPLILDMLIKNILLINNVRLARPGEFSERAFLNEKIDLIQAEATMDLIHAQSKLAIQASLKSLQGFFSQCINKIFQRLNSIYSNIEAAINFPEDINDNILLKNIDNKIYDVISLIKKVKKKAVQGNLLREGIKIVITGTPNVGKSSLLNRLLNKNVAIVTNLAGTTRDLIRSYINIKGLTFELIDTAGLCDSNNVIEKIGIKLAKDVIKKSNHVFLVLDSSKKDEFNELIIKNYIKKLNKNQIITLIFNKIDLTKKKSCITRYKNKYTSIYVSVKSGLGIDLLRKYMRSFSRSIDSSENLFLARRRHLQILTKTLKLLEDGLKNWIDFQTIELLSDTIKLANTLISEISGKFINQDILEKFFSEFCIGK
ncbi:GTP-binding protein [Buchnera aphidicola (Cinara tujafilina)]|uniref:tRNA modification GTPase MnmE n=1 Tax=Buchnera aphidicola (Cinara tujafilina) TaxID=261317 RepID=F7WYV8_9GAMM|nr:tRNA uridine-5-carboxymethylaminomethyl(34) synthesis GTPase MnmE [Buchnera aphidicola]AEH39608.1 GTP-binding protein [Buchnera aphidicola (Cinara tujafilina)]